jgi:hypothetical protein
MLVARSWTGQMKYEKRMKSVPHCEPERSDELLYSENKPNERK